MKDAITVEVRVQAPVEKVWEYFTEPEHVTKWNHASDDWHSPSAQNDLRVGGKFLFRMEAKDGSAGFDFGGVYDAVAPHRHISYMMGDGRKVETTFAPGNGGVRVTTVFEPESENTPELQRSGWQAILDNFKMYAENSAKA